MSTDDQSDTRSDDENAEVSSEALEEGALSAAPSEEVGAGRKTLGLERWVQLTFFAGALLFVWLFDHLIAAIWYAFADPDETIVTLGAILCGGATTVMLYRQPVVHATIHDTVDELSKVSWPTRTETSSSTIIVVVTSIVAALMLFLFDSVWSAVTDLVYKV